jgi:hypothetical protein
MKRKDFSFLKQIVCCYTKYSKGLILHRWYPNSLSTFPTYLGAVILRLFRQGFIISPCLFLFVGFAPKTISINCTYPSPASLIGQSGTQPSLHACNSLKDGYSEANFLTVLFQFSIEFFIFLIKSQVSPKLERTFR